MKKKKQVIFPPNRKTEFARFTDPADFSFDPDLSRSDLQEESFFEDAGIQAEQRNDYQP